MQAAAPVPKASHPSVCTSLRGWLADEGYRVLGRLPAAERGTSVLLIKVGWLLQDMGRLDDAEPLLREALDAKRATLGDRHPSEMRTDRSRTRADAPSRLERPLTTSLKRRTRRANGRYAPPLFFLSRQSDHNTPTIGGYK